MSKFLQYFLATSYVALVLVGLISVLLKTLHGFTAGVFIWALLVMTVSFMIVLRKEEDEELNG